MQKNSYFSGEIKLLTNKQVIKEVGYIEWKNVPC